MRKTPTMATFSSWRLATSALLVLAVVGVDSANSLAQSPSEVDSGERFKVLVVPPRIEIDDASAPQFMDDLVKTITMELRSYSQLDVVVVSADELRELVPPAASQFTDARRVKNALTHKYGRSFVAEASVAPLPEDGAWSVVLNWTWSEANRYPFSTVRDADHNEPGNDAVSIGSMLASRVGRSLNDRRYKSPPSSNALEALLNSSTPEEERLDILSDIRGTGFSPEIIGAGVELGTLAASSEVRQEAWLALRRHVFDPILVPALSSSLFSDPDENVRLQATVALSAYTNDSAAQGALQLAIVSDVSPKVRLAARIAPMQGDEQLALFEALLFDESLLLAERAAPLLLDNTMRVWHANPPDSFVRLYAELASAADDIEIKAAALTYMQLAHQDRTGDLGAPKRRRANPDTAVVDAVIEALEFPSSTVRSPAIRLIQMISDQRARDAYAEWVAQR